MGDLFGEIARLDRLVSRILDYARPVQLHKSHVDITKLVSAVVELYRPVLAEKGMDVTFESSATPIMLKCDPDQVTECLVNLLKNAMEAMAHGGHLWVSISATANEVVIKVTDDGAGIAEGLQKKLFSLFVTTKLSGTGLGLSHVYKIMLAHGGRVEVESSPELAARGLAQRGATVRLEFPIYQ